MLKMIVIIVLGWFIINNLYICACGTIEEAFYSKFLHSRHNLEKLKNDILRYPTTKEGLILLCKNISNIKGWKGSYDDDFCNANEIDNKYVYRNVNGKIIFYSKGKNEVDEQGFGDDMREPITIFEHREAKNLKFILFNSIYISFFLGVIFTMIVLKNRKRSKVIVLKQHKH